MKKFFHIAFPTTNLKSQRRSIDMEKTLHETVIHWASMSFKENPYGSQIPRKYLYDFRVMNKTTPQCVLADFMQDGNVMDYIFNDKSKMSAAEKEETVQFSDIFHRLEVAGTLCPSNYIVEVINDLEKWDVEHNTRHDDNFYCKTIARGMRSFASILREINLREIIDDYLKAASTRRGYGYTMYQASVKEDMQFKTDISIKFGGALYRLWSYQCTSSGVKKTSERIKKGAGQGYNVLIPFDMETAEYVHRWAFYPEAYVKSVIDEFVLRKQTYVITHTMYKKQVEANMDTVKVPAMFRMP